MNALELSCVTLRLPGRAVLEDVSFAVPEGSFVGLLGANGAGKTTLMRALLGLIPAAAGRILVLGRAAGRGLAGIGYVPQRREGALLRLSGRDMVAAAAAGTRLLPFTGQALHRQVDEAIELVGATRLARRPLADLSGGEAQRLLLAQALLHRPRLLLMDEPLVGLDPTAQSHIVRLVRDLQCRLGLTVLFSAHELNPVLPAMDLVLYLANRRAAIGQPQEVITAETLSRLYGAPVDVQRAGGRVFVLPALAA